MQVQLESGHTPNNPEIAHSSSSVNCSSTGESSRLPKNNNNTNKSRKSKNSSRTSQRHSFSLNALPSSTGFVDPSVSANRATVTERVFEALAKFQSCLFLLSNTVVRLHESLKLIVPFESAPVRAATSGTSENLEMVRSTMCPILGKIHNSARSDNNNTTSTNKGKSKIDTVVNVANAAGSPEKISDVQKGKSEKDDKDSVNKHLARLFQYIGIILSLFTSVCISLVTLIVKIMDGYHPVSKVIWRLQGVLLPSLLIVLYVKYYQKKPLVVWRKDGNENGQKRSNYWKWQILFFLLIRGIVGCSADIFQYYSLKTLPLADSTVIAFSTPIFVCIVAHFVLGEKWGIVPIFTALLTLCGVIVICKPPILTGAEPMSKPVVLGNIMAILCMICNTFATVVTRYLQHVHFAVTMLALGVFGTIEGFIVTLFTSPPELPAMGSAVDWMLAVLIAGLFFFGQLSMTLALQHEEACVVSLVRTCDVLFAFIWQVNFLHQDANLYSYIGALIVTVGVILTALRRWVGDLPEDGSVRKYLSFILR